MKTILLSAILIGLVGVACQPQKNHTVQNLETFARLYGYARWFHPSDEAQAIDWDKFAILGVQKVESIQSTTALRDTLYQLFSPIVQGLQIYEADKPQEFDPKLLLSPDPNAKLVVWQHDGVRLGEQSNVYRSCRTHTATLFDSVPQWGEVTKADIGSRLIAVVPLTLQTNGAATYPKSDATSLARLQDQLANVSISSGFNRQKNLASIIMTWTVIQHFFPYFDVIDVDWNRVLNETLVSTLGNKVKQDFYVTLSRMVAQLEDGHGIVFGEELYKLPIRTEYVEDKIVVTASQDTALKRGDILHAIDGKPALEALHEKEQIISGSPHLRRHRALNVLGAIFDPGEKRRKEQYDYSINNPKGEPAPNGTRLTIERDGILHDVTATKLAPGSLFFNLVDERKYLAETITEIEPGIYYVNMATCSANVFDDNKSTLARAKAVIYDERGGGRLDFDQIVPHLIEKPVTSPWWNTPQIVYPDRREMVFDKANWDIQPKQPRFTSKTIIINVPSVVSAGETMAGIIDHYKLATTVGEPTAGCNGNFNRIDLPCGYQVMWTGMRVLKHDGSQLYGKGFAPNYPVSKTLQAIKEGRDEYLEKALELAR